MRKVVKIHSFSPCLGDGLFNLRSFMPFIERSYRDDLWPCLHSRIKSVLIILPINPVPCILGVPRPYAGVDITWPYTWNEYQVIIITEGFDGSPVVMWGTIRKAIGCKIRVESIKSSSLYVLLMLFFHKKSNEDAIIRCVPNGRYTIRLKQFCPNIWSL